MEPSGLFITKIITELSSLYSLKINNLYEIQILAQISENQNQRTEPACFICSQTCIHYYSAKKTTAPLQTSLNASRQRGQNQHAYMYKVLLVNANATSRKNLTAQVKEKQKNNVQHLKPLKHQNKKKKSVFTVSRFHGVLNDIPFHFPFPFSFSVPSLLPLASSLFSLLFVVVRTAPLALTLAKQCEPCLETEKIHYFRLSQKTLIKYKGWVGVMLCNISAA